jgi:hypothetical protein
MVLALPKIMECYSRYDIDEVVVTSGTEGEHMEGSKHYTNNALDFRTRISSPMSRQGLVMDIKFDLGPNYDVVDEIDHIHVEFDPK